MRGVQGTTHNRGQSRPYKVSPIGIHFGEALRSFALDYETVMLLIAEMVQNALDENAQNIRITVNKKTRTILVDDDGKGVSIAAFEEKLSAIAYSVKRDRKDKIGKWGKALFSWVDKCKQFSFISRSRVEKDGRSKYVYNQWDFDCKELLSERTAAQARLKECDYSYAGPRKKIKKDQRNLVRWITRIEVKNYTQDSVQGTVTRDELEETILDRYGHEILNLGSRLKISICIIEKDGSSSEKPLNIERFNGEPLPLFENEDISVQLYRAPIKNGKRRGKIKFGEHEGKGSRITARAFNIVAIKLLPQEILDALVTTSFNGEILAKKAVLTDSRKSFAKDDRFISFCVSIEEWWKKVGNKLFSSIKEEQKLQKVQAIALSILPVIDTMMRERFSDILDTFTFGSRGKGHFKNTKIGPRNGPAVAKGRGKDKGKRTPKGTGTTSPPDPDKEHKNHHPTVVHTLDGTGTSRIKVRGSTGIHLGFSEKVLGSSALYEVDFETGDIEFNISHPLWSECSDHSKSALRQLQLAIVKNFITLCRLPEHRREDCRKALDLALEADVFIWTKGKKLLKK